MTNRNQLMKRVGMIALMSLPVSAWAISDVGTQCAYAYNPATDFVVLDPANFDGCVTLRGNPETSALVLTKDSNIATGCPVTIANLVPHPGTACPMVHDSLHPGDEVRVDDWGQGKLKLTISSNGHDVIQGKPLTPTVVTLSDGKTITVGYHTDVQVLGSGPIRYDVYLMHKKVNVDGQEKLVKFYSVDVFGPSAACRAEVPSAATVARVDCDDLPVTDVTVKQLPSGGGGEPPPKPGS